VTVAKKLAEALRAELARQAMMATALESADEEIAKAAWVTFEGPVGAAWWLTAPAMALQGRVPLDVSTTSCGKTEVLRVLARIDRDLPL
jgi:uncharacterized protein (DUF2384 family)